MSISITLNLKKAALFKGALSKAFDEAISRAAVRIENELLNLTPMDTGWLRATFRATPTTSGVKMSWGADYARYPDAGTPAHEIRVHDSRSAIPTPYGFFKKVQHPGQPPQNYTTITGMAALEIMKEELARAILEIQAEIG